MIRINSRVFELKVNCVDDLWPFVREIPVKTFWENALRYVDMLINARKFALINISSTITFIHVKRT